MDSTEDEDGGMEFTYRRLFVEVNETARVYDAFSTNKCCMVA